MPRRFSSGRRSASIPVRALTRAVLPWSMCPAVPTRKRFTGEGYTKAWPTLPPCHPERSEGSALNLLAILPSPEEQILRRFAPQNDRARVIASFRHAEADRAGHEGRDEERRQEACFDAASSSVSSAERENQFAAGAHRRRGGSRHPASGQAAQRSDRGLWPHCTSGPRECRKIKAGYSRGLSSSGDVGVRPVCDDSGDHLLEGLL